jgi:GNAT superfamily N-acetyltransferase
MVMPDGAIGGYYTLSSAALRLHALPEDVAKRLPRYPKVPATLIGRLAIDRHYYGQGWGSFLLLDALYRCARSEVFAVIVDALDDEARAFYIHHSFLPLPDSPHRLFRRMSDIAALFEVSDDSPY